MRKSILAALLAFALVIGLLSGCRVTPEPTPSPTPTAVATPATVPSSKPTGETVDKSETYTIGVLLYKGDDAYISSVCRVLETEADSTPEVELIIRDAENSQAVQDGQLDELIGQGADALIVNLVNINAAQAVIDKLREANIPVVFFNREPLENVLKSYEKARYVGTVPHEAGEIQGGIIVSLWNTDLYDTNADDIVQYVMLMGEADNPEAIARTEYSVMTVENAGIGTEALDTQVCNWDPVNAYDAMSDWMLRFGERIEFVIANNDSMAVGAVKALQEAGYNNGGDDFIPVVGVDAIEEARGLIASGFMSGTVVQGVRSMARASLALALNAAKGNEFLHGTAYIYDSSDIAVRIPYHAYSNEQADTQTVNRPVTTE